MLNEKFQKNYYVLSKLCWQFTVGDFSKTWIIQSPDNVVRFYLHLSLDIPTSSTLSHLKLPKSKVGLNLQLPLTKLPQC